MSATQLNLYGLGLGVAGGITIGANHLTSGAVLLSASLACDSFDGPVARYQGKDSAWGAFIDSVADRCVDMAAFSGVAWLYLTHDRYLLGAISLTALLTASITSYVKARAEALGAKAEGIGLLQRPERIIGLVLGLAIPGALDIMLAVLAALGLLTAAQRVTHYMRELS